MYIKNVDKFIYIFNSIFLLENRGYFELLFFYPQDIHIFIHILSTYCV